MSRIVGQIVDLEHSQVGEWVHLQIPPHVLNRIEFGRVRRQHDCPIIWATPQECLCRLGTMRPEPVPDQELGAVKVLAQDAKKLPNVSRSDAAIGMKTKIQTHPVAGGSHAQCGDDGYLVVRASSLVEKRCTPSTTPGTSHQWCPQQPAFVQKQQPGFQPRGVFFTFGHWVCTQPSISASSRSTAHRWGFCGLHPKPCRSRPT